MYRPFLAESLGAYPTGTHRLRAMTQFILCHSLLFSLVSTSQHLTSYTSSPSACDKPPHVAARRWCSTTPSCMLLPSVFHSAASVFTNVPTYFYQLIDRRVHSLCLVRLDRLCFMQCMPVVHLLSFSNGVSWLTD